MDVRYMVWVYTWYGIYRYIPSIYPPPNQGLGIYPFLGLQLGGPPGPPRVLFGGHKGQFGSWGAPQSVVASFHKLQLIVVHVWPTNSVH